MNKSRNQETREKGSALVEFALCIGLFWLPVFLGTFQVGFSLVREIQVTQICRDAGHMYAQGTDFSLPVFQNLLASLAPTSMTISATGNTVLYLSTVNYVDDTQCPNGLQPDSTACPNYHRIVFLQQIPVGNTSLRQSNFGGASAAVDSSYNVISPLTDTNAVATGFSSVIPMDSSIQYAYVSEMYVRSTDLAFWSYLGTPGQYARSVF